MLRTKTEKKLFGKGNLWTLSHGWSKMCTVLGNLFSKKRLTSSTEEWEAHLKKRWSQSMQICLSLYSWKWQLYWKVVICDYWSSEMHTGKIKQSLCMCLVITFLQSGLLYSQHLLNPNTSRRYRATAMPTLIADVHWIMNRFLQQILSSFWTNTLEICLCVLCILMYWY